MMIRHITKRYAGLIQRTSFLFVSTNFLFFYGCQSKERELQLKQLWRTSIVESSTRTAESIYPIQVGDVALTARLLDNAAPVFYALDMKQGGIRWQGTDTSCSGKVYYNMEPFTSKYGVVVPCGKALKCMDTNTGEIRWSYQQSGQPEQLLEPCTSSTFLQAVNDWDGRKSHIYTFNSMDGEAKRIYTIKWPDSSKLLLRTPVKVDGTLLLFSSILMQYGTNKTVAKWHLLNSSTNKIISEGMAYPENNNGYGVTKQPVVIGNKAFMVAYDNVFCVSTTDGKELWRKELPRDMLTAMPIVSENGLFCPMEDGYVYKLNLNNGNVLWKAKIATTPSRPVIIKGLLFIVGGSDGILYVVSTKDGKIVKRLKAPNHHFIRNQFFRRFIGVDSEGEILILFDGNSFRGYKIWN